MSIMAPVVENEEAPTSCWWVYIIRSRSGKLYTGITTDVERRLLEHQTDKRRGAKFFRSDPAQEVVYREALENRATATRRELAIKRLSRQEKLLLIAR